MPVFFRTEIHFLGTALRVAVLQAAVMVAATTVAAEMVTSLDVDRLLDDFAVGDAGMA
jgi:hypothetical protein